MDECSYEARKSASKERTEVTVHAERRRRWSAEEKLLIVRETLRPGAVARAVADRQSIGTGLLYMWRKQMLTAAMTEFAAVEMAAEPETPPLLATSGAVAEALLQTSSPWAGMGSALGESGHVGLQGAALRG